MADDGEAAVEENLCYKLRNEKSAGGEVVRLQWSPTMDVIAIAFADHTIAVNRLSWQRVWSIEPAKSDVTCLSWRPDGRVLAAGYSNGRVALYCVENGECLHETHLVGLAAVTTMSWQEEASDNSDKKEKYPDHSTRFLPGLPDLNKLEDSDILDPAKRTSVNLANKKKLKTVSNAFHVLIVGDKNGQIHFCVSGVLYSAVIALPQDHVISMCVSHDLQHIDVLSSNNEAPFKHTKVDMSVLVKKKEEFQYVALKYGQMDAALHYMEGVVQAMSDAWEDSLLTVDRKLAKYSQDLPDNVTVADEFIMLLGCGKPRRELKNFLVDELTAGGVKKLGLTLEMSYNSIRMMLVNHINRTIQMMDFYLHEMLGVANWTDRFGGLGLTRTAVQRALQALGSFALKSQELLFLIDQSSHHLRVFFTWLYSIILKLSGDSIPQSLGESFTIEDLGIITEFLNSRFKSNTSVHDQTFSMERVGQYFANENLKFIDETTQNPSLLEKVLKDVGLNQTKVSWIIEPKPEKSLRQLFEIVKLNIISLFGSIKDSISERVSVSPSLDLPSQYRIISQPLPLSSENIVLFHVRESDTTVFIYPTNTYDMMLLCRQGSNTPVLGRFFISNKFHESPEKPVFRILSLSYYSSEFLSVLFSTRDRTDSGFERNRIQSVWSGVAQVPIPSLLSIPLVPLNQCILSSSSFEQDINDLVPRTDIVQYLKQLHNLHKFIPSIASFSGTRKLASVVSSNRKRVQLFDVDFDEDEEDEEKGESSEEENL